MVPPRNAVALALLTSGVWAQQSCPLGYTVKLAGCPASTGQNLADLSEHTTTTYTVRYYIASLIISVYHHPTNYYFEVKTADVARHICFGNSLATAIDSTSGAARDH